MIGERFGRWLVVGQPQGKRKKVPCWCECGKRREVREELLRSGKSRSCGCLSSELVSKRMRTHGMSKSPEFCAWAAIKRRCRCKQDASYPGYGGRGIDVCDEWFESFEAFFEHVGPRPGPGYSIDRIDNGRGYEPGNVRWATYETQNRNTRGNRVLTVKGESKTTVEWSETVGLSASIISRRLQNGWSEEDAVLLPAMKRGTRYHRGRFYPLHESQERGGK